MNQSLVVMRSFAAQKLRRLHSLESYSSKMSERNNLVNLMNSLMRRMMSSRTKYLLGGAVLLGKQSFDWSKREILAEESEQYYNHINECHDIQLKTKSGIACEWTPFIERKDILVWRREHLSMKGMYEYKMYGSFDDVTAEEFLSVQLDMTEFRLTWDKSTAQVRSGCRGNISLHLENISVRRH